MKILFLDSVHEILEQKLTNAGHECLRYWDKDIATCKIALKEVDGIVIRSRIRMDESFLSHGSQLKFIARSGAGMENIDVEYCDRRGIVLFNAPEGNRNAVAEHALGMLLSLFNKLHTADRDVRLGKWERELNRGIELAGKTVGIIGYGNNGSAFAKKLQGFDVDIIAYDKYKSGFGNTYVEEVELEVILQRSDIISLHIPQNEETRYMINNRFIDSVEKPFFLINLSRGKLVRTDSLVDALKSKKILGACLDVLEYEKSSFETIDVNDLPEDFSYLLQSENVILSPHVGGWTHESYYKLSDVLAEKILGHFN